MIKKSIMPSHLEDILRKNVKKDPYKDFYLDKTQGVLYTDWLEKNPLDDMYKVYVPNIKPKKRIFKDTAHVFPGPAVLEGKLRAHMGELLSGSTFGGFSVGQLVSVIDVGLGVVIGFFRHHDFPYTRDENAYIDNEEEMEDDGAAIRAEVLVGGEFHRVPLPNLSAATEGMA